jgi:hypothetical protein
MECPRAHASATSRPTMRCYLRVGELWFETLGTPADSRELIRGTRVTDAAAHRQPPSHARRGAPTSAARDVRPRVSQPCARRDRPDSRQHTRTLVWPTYPVPVIPLSTATSTFDTVRVGSAAGQTGLDLLLFNSPLVTRADPPRVRCSGGCRVGSNSGRFRRAGMAFCSVCSRR